MRRSRFRRYRRQPKGRNPRLLSPNTVRAELADMRARRSSLTNRREEFAKEHRIFSTAQSAAWSRMSPIHSQILAITDTPSHHRTYLSIFQGKTLTVEAQSRVNILNAEIQRISAAIPAVRYEIDGQTYNDFADVCRVIDTQLAFLNKQIPRYEKVILRHDLQQERVERLTAVAATNEGVSRGIASKMRRNIQHEGVCPYCAGPLGSNTHLDHIYPVAKGGKSIRANLVMVCGSCNAKKSQLTLGKFCNKFDFDYLEVQRRLAALGKDF
jgi:5-methylcytosine-specific restriction endonuclease McrA